MVKILCGLSFLGLLGVAGASDQGLINLGTAVWQGCIALILTIIFAKLGGLLK